MAAKIAVHYEKYKKMFPETGELQGYAWKMLNLQILELHTSSL